MEIAHFTPLAVRAADPGLIPGIYNYCDRRCDRCGFTDRCLTYRDTDDDVASCEHAGTARGLNGPADGRMTRSLHRAIAPVEIIAEREGIDLAPESEDVPDDVSVGEEAARRAQTERDPIIVRARDYATTAASVAKLVRPIAMERGDIVTVDAVNTIEWLCESIASKMYRAVYGSGDAAHDAGDVQSDVNGSAKIARLMIVDSARAWSVLMEIGRAVANGVPARLVRALSELDANIASRFPRAMDFVRPGFDR